MVSLLTYRTYQNYDAKHPSMIKHNPLTNNHSVFSISSNKVTARLFRKLKQLGKVHKLIKRDKTKRGKKGGKKRGKKKL